MKKLDNPQCISNKFLTQQQFNILIENLYGDMEILLSEYMQMINDETVFEEALRCLTFHIYQQTNNHRAAFEVVKNGIDQGIMLYKNVQDEELKRGMHEVKQICHR